MKSIALTLTSLLVPSVLCASHSNLTQPLSSRILLPTNFKPPAVFQNANLVRNVNLEKGYVRETINVIIENVDKKPQSDYYIPFEVGTIERVGGLEVRDKKQDNAGPFGVQAVEYDPLSPIQFYRIRLPEPLKPKSQQTLSISFSILDSLSPLPAKINQMDKQYLAYTFSAYSPSAYKTLKQKTKAKFPSGDVPEYTTLVAPNAEGKEDPQKQGSTFTYGPYGEVPAGAQEPVTVRYDFTRPVLHCSVLERDIEVSHWGGNIATEERYWMENLGANLSTHFSRVSWATTQYYNPPTSALKELRMPLRGGSANAYFTDDIGNVSTSRFRTNAREAMLELKPRYPLFGGWKYSFKIGWDNDLKTALRKLSTGDTYVLKVPFLEGPKQPEGVEYSKVHLRVLLPEGATNVQYQTAVPLTSAEEYLHKTYMDTVGRTTLHLTAINMVDDQRNRDLIVTYDYTFIAGLRKPLTIIVGILSVFFAAYAIGSIDVSIGKKS
ncbi:MAG: dolichyl-diphosphooligosaccharide--protein glycosyltransferase subunit 1 [Vezdaea aestivalis]|nr:MAG: dolichyl-diphosphooligosaccharide--protein glycosyltransferase subunit 1 [Vezdaea aestivalis]